VRMTGIAESSGRDGGGRGGPAPGGSRLRDIDLDVVVAALLGCGEANRAAQAGRASKTSSSKPRKIRILPFTPPAARVSPSGGSSA